MTHAPVAKKRDDEEQDEVIVPPDGGWGWWVVFASFAIHIVTDGVTYTFGIFFVEFVDYFKAGNAETSWIASILVGVTLCSGPFSSAFVNKYGCRAVTIAGCVIAGICLILSVFAKNVFTLYITIGLGTGFGFGMIYLPAIVCVTMYFERLRSLATGIAVCGSGFGTLVFAPITNYLITTYKWQGALLVISGIVFFCSIFGAMFRPLKPVKVEKEDVEEGRTEPLLENTKGSNHKVAENNKELIVASSPSKQIQRSKSIEHADFQKNGDVTGSEISDNGKLLVSNSKKNLAASQPFLHRLDHPDKKAWYGSGTLDRPDAFYTGSIQNIARHRSRSSINADVEKHSVSNHELQLKNIDEDLEETTEESLKVCGCIPCSPEAKRVLKGMMSLSLFKDPVFIVFLISNFLTSIGFNVPYVYTAAQAEKLGVSKQYASYLLSIIGFANTIGRIILGYYSDKPYVNRLMVYNACLTICGTSTALSVLCFDFWSMSVYTMFYGFTIGAYVGLTSVILVDLLGLENLTNAFGLLLLFQGVASFVGPPIAGALYDLTKSYTPGFIVAGVTIAFSGLILFLIPPLQKRQLRREQQEASEAFKNELSLNPL
jgi:MFS family permease